VLGIRPEDLQDVALAPDTPAGRRMKGNVVLREALGSEIMVHFGVDARPAVTEETRELAEDIGDDRTAQAPDTPAPETVIVGRFGARSRVQEGGTIEAAVDTRALHFFDSDTGLGIYEGKG